jgi:hypothetical protein
LLWGSAYGPGYRFQQPLTSDLFIEALIQWKKALKEIKLKKKLSYL